MNNEEQIRQDTRKVMLNLLIRLDEVCHKNNLHYYLAVGTCLGAVRHKGFIPWDDDIDVLMPIQDIKKLIGLQDQFGERYFIQCKETDPEYRATAMRLRDSETTYFQSNEAGQKNNKGIYVDIYPFYEVPKNPVQRRLDILRSHVFRMLVYRRPVESQGKLKYLISKVVLAMYPGEKADRKIKKIEDHLISVRGDEVRTYFGGDIWFLSAITYKKEWFGEPTKLEFEGMFFDGPHDPDQYLTKRYGDYMTLPPVEKRVTHHENLIIDPYRSYREYEEVDQNG
ncbi:MAG: LicD family protein [Blautia sp.]|nr:LicD family protein [Blautia sp.]